MQFSSKCDGKNLRHKVKKKSLDNFQIFSFLETMQNLFFQESKYLCNFYSKMCKKYSLTL